MRVRVVTVPSTVRVFTDAKVTFDKTVLQVVHGTETTTFPLANVISFTTSESGTT